MEPLVTLRIAPLSDRKLTEYCQRGEHAQCAGHVYVGHSFEEGAQHEPCACTCHHALPKAA